jgi:LysR family transcriptional regulator, nitrogen assimilation regulatory protein
VSFCLRPVINDPRTLEGNYKTIKFESPQGPLWAYHLCSADMNVQQLRYLIAVSDFGSVSAAARSLGVTQPVVSRSVHAFESEHGVTMFALSGTRLVMTEAAEPIVDAARNALAAFDVVGETVQAVRDKRELVIATTPTNGLLLTKALSELRRCEPALVIRVCRANDAEDVLRIVLEGTAEIGFSELTPLVRNRQLTGVPVAELEVVFVSPMGTDLPSEVTWNDVVMQPLIVPPPDSGRRELINDMAMKASGTTPQSTVVFEDRGSWMAAAQAGMGSFLSYRCVVADHEDIELRPFTPRQTVAVGFVHQNLELSTAARRFIDLARHNTWEPAER